MTRKHLDTKADTLLSDHHDNNGVSIKKEAKLMKVERKPAISSSSSSSLIDAARAMGLDIPPPSTDSMSSISALLAAAQATGGLPASCTTSSASTKQPQVTSATSAQGPSQGLDLSNPQTAMANVNVRKHISRAIYLIN